MSGVFISKGMRLSILPGDLIISADGLSNTLTPHVHFDVCPMWFDLSLGHLARARVARSDRDAAWGGVDEHAKGAALEREFEAAMQAITSAAIAVDAFYAVVQSKVAISDDTRKAWSTNRTARATRISETIRQGFTLTPTDAQMLQANLGEVFRIRDMAVHPTGKLDQPLLHTELQIGVEWRFETFRSAIAQKVVHAALSMVWQLSACPKLLPDLRAYLTGLHELLRPVVARWPADLEPIVGPKVEPIGHEGASES